VLLAVISPNENAPKESLEKAHSDLEIKVAQRTAELQAVNKRLTDEIEKRKKTETHLNARNIVLELLTKSTSRKEYSDNLVQCISDWGRWRCAGIKLLDKEIGFFMNHSRDLAKNFGNPKIVSR